MDLKLFLATNLYIRCPYDKFRCYYGACVNKAFRCDGKFQCVDKSDENTCDHNTQSCGYVNYTLH